MKLGLLERWLVNSPLRRLSLYVVEPRALQNLAAFPHGASVLDLGCGNGHGLVMLAREASPSTLTGVDIDEEQLRQAQRTLATHGVKATLIHASANKLPLPAQAVDVVTSFGALHHIQAWQQGVGEVARILRPGGLFYMLEFYRPLLTVISPFITHPPQRFTHQQLVQELLRQRFTVLGHKNIFGLWGFIAARRPVDEPDYN